MIQLCPFDTSLNYQYVRGRPSISQKRASLTVDVSLSVQDGAVGAQICSAFLFVLRDWGHFTTGSSTADRKRVYVKNIRLTEF